MKKVKGLLPIAFCIPALVLVGGCVGATFVRTGAAYPAKASNCVIEVFSAELPDREYEELGIVEGEGSLWKADMEDMMPLLKEETCLAGGDALILHSAQRYVTGDDGTENL